MAADSANLSRSYVTLGLTKFETWYYARFIKIRQRTEGLTEWKNRNLLTWVKKITKVTDCYVYLMIRAIESQVCCDSSSSNLFKMAASGYVLHWNICNLFQTVYTARAGVIMLFAMRIELVKIVLRVRLICEQHVSGTSLTHVQFLSAEIVVYFCYITAPDILSHPRASHHISYNVLKNTCARKKPKHARRLNLEGHVLYIFFQDTNRTLIVSMHWYKTASVILSDVFECQGRNMWVELWIIDPRWVFII